MSWDGAIIEGAFSVDPPGRKARSPRKQFQKLLRRDLLPYQTKWLDDNSRFKIGLWARQSGKDWAASAEAVLDCMQRPGTLWAIVAAGERQALESLRKAKEWAAILHYALEGYHERRAAKGALLNSAEIVWSNKSRLIALPARPETVRGYSANLILTEFAFHENPTEIWRAIYPSISNPLRGGQKRLRIISTPNGPGDKFHELWSKSDYAKHRVTIHEAVEQGLEVDVEALRRGLGDEEGWAQEYECQFLDAGSVLLPYELIATCEDDDATEARGRGAVGALVCGIDFGRRRDRTVCWTLEKVGDVLWTREVLVLDKMSTPEQVEILRTRLARAQRACLDYTGAGVGLGDYLAQEFGPIEPAQHRFGKIELCSFTAGLKAELFSKLRIAFENRALRVPSSSEIREDLHGVQRVASRGGQVSYRAAQSEDGHSDRCTALALALRAAGEAREKAASAPVILRERLMGRAPRRHRV
jgi:phage FluMu gp28-like protein